MRRLVLAADELILGDAVLLFDEPYGWGTVVRIGASDPDADPDFVEIFRPFVHIGDFEYTGGVLHYIGTETIKVYRKGNRTFEVDAATHERMVLGLK